LKRGFILLLAAVLFFVSAGAPLAEAKRRSASRPANRYASIVIDAATGTVLSQSNPDRHLYPASLTKMMTLYLTFEAISKGTLRKNQRLSVSSHAAVQVPSKIGLEPGETIRVEDAILSLVTKSANDVAVVLAEGIGGSEARFAQMMNQRAQQLGMRNTHFVNASGLHTPLQYSSARDMATLARALIYHYPNEYRYFKTRTFFYAGATIRNHNHMLETYPGMDGIKTGYIYASGYNLVASAVRNNHRLIGVVFGGRTTVSRNNHMAELLDTGFERVGGMRIARKAETPPLPGGDAADDDGATASQNVALPVRKPASGTSFSVAERLLAQNPGAGNTDDGEDDDGVQVADNRSLGLVGVEQGDREQGGGALYIQKQKTGTAVRIIRPTPPASTPVSGKRTSDTDSWAIQVGAFATHDAGIAALRRVRDQLPKAITVSSQYVISPLMTSRGMIYRARMSGLSREQATEACSSLKENCLILANP
jgi:D-alanyl-D-alanine carboxypeptidase